MIKQIQEIVQNFLEAKKLTDSVYGIIESVDPLTVKIDNRFTVDESFLTFLSFITKESLKVGDKLLLLRVKNGQQFIVLSEETSIILQRMDELERKCKDLEMRVTQLESR